MKRSQREDGSDQYQQLHQRQSLGLQQRQQQKTLNSRISKIRIGDWSIETRYSDDDLIMKCYFAKRKLMWEILDKTSLFDIHLKRKIEINWSDLLSCDVHINPQDNTGIFEIKLKKRPTFHIETNQRPGKHTLWKQINEDFTTNQSASTCATHTLYFASGELQKSIDKLLSGDSHFWYPLLHRQQPNNNNTNGSTNGLNVNYPNFNMDQTQQICGNDERREVVVNSSAQNQQVLGNDLNESKDWSELKNKDGSWNTDHILSVLPPMQEELSCTLQDTLDQLYSEGAFDHMTRSEPVPEAVKPALEPVLKSSDPVQEAQKDLEYALKTCNQGEETEANSRIVQDPNLQDMEQLHGLSVYDQERVHHQINLENRDEEDSHQIKSTTQRRLSSDFDFEDPAYLSLLMSNNYGV